MDTYRKLVAEYPSLTCQCQRITAAYSIFLTISPTYHQVCSSIFVSNVFRITYPDDGLAIPLGKFDIHIAIPTYYASGRVICSIMQGTASQAINTFLETIYVSSDLTDENEFNSRMNASLNNFEALAPATFTQLIRLIQGTTRGNQLLTGSFTNAELQYNISSTTEENVIDILWINPNYESCNCGLSSNSCAISYEEYCNSTDHNTADDTCSGAIPGLIISCYLLDGLLVSTIECLYDIACVTDM